MREERAQKLYLAFGALSALESKSFTSAHGREVGLSVGKGFGDILVSVARSAAQSEAKELIENSLSELSKAVAIDLAGGLAGLGVRLVLSSILVGQDRTGRLLERMRSEPFQTARRVLEETLRMPVTSPIEQDLRISKLKHADNELEKAFTLANEQREQMLVRLIQGLCELELTADSFARVHLTECASFLGRECEANEKRIGMLREELDRECARMEEFAEEERKRKSGSRFKKILRGYMKLCTYGVWSAIEFARRKSSEGTVKDNTAEIHRLEIALPRLRDFKDRLLMLCQASR